MAGAGGPDPIIIESGQGAWVTDVQGNRYLDAMSGQWCVNAGYGRDELAEAAAAQLKQLAFFPLTQSHPPAIALAERLSNLLGGDRTVLFSNSGSEANEVAFKLARQYHQQHGDHGRFKIIARYRAYHGSTMGALSATGQAMRRYRYEPLAPGFLHVPPPDLYRKPEAESDEAYGLRMAHELEQVIRFELPETVAAVIMEPIITGGGIIVPPDSYLPAVAEACARHGVLLIVDEVICGFARTGTWFGHQRYESVKPDIVTMAKGITSGYLPLAATAVSTHVLEAFGHSDSSDRLRHINTFGGHPAACAVALANLDLMEREDLVGRSAQLGERLLERLHETLGDHPNVGSIRGRGLLAGVEIVADRATKEPDGALATAVVGACKRHGLIVGRNAETAAGLDNVVALSPPLNLTEDDLDFIVTTLAAGIEEASAA
jgi:adenosylmethionine-8-amino-7-oxononanoate aminotransferase